DKFFTGAGLASYYLYREVAKGSISREDIPGELFDKFFTGAGLASYYLYREVPKGADPLGPENRLILMTGALTGTVAPSTGRFNWVFKSPLTGLWAQSNSAGFWGVDFKKTGYDGIIFEGISPEPVYVLIKDDKAELRSAKHLWGKNVTETTALLKTELGQEFNIDCIGVAGEKKVKFASIMNDLHRAAGRCGGGAVMGSKNLKAIAVSGKKPVKIANPAAFNAVAQKQFELLDQSMLKATMETFGTNVVIDMVNARGGFPTRNWQSAEFPSLEDINAQALSEKVLVETLGCFACPLKCGRGTEIRQGKYKGEKGEGPEYESVGTLGGSCQVNDMEAITKAHYLCDDYGLDTISAGSTIGFAIECFEKGVLTRADTGGIEMKYGDPDLVIDMIHKIANREGIGNLLAEGTRAISRKLGHGTERYAMQVKGLELPAYDSRAVQITGLAYAVANRGGDHITAYIQGPTFLDIPFLIIPDSHINDPHVADPNEVHILVELENALTALDILGACKFMGMCVDSSEWVELVKHCLGRKFTYEDMMKIGERAVNLARLFNVREGITRADDTLPARLLEEPLPDGPAAGKVNENLPAMLDKYYELRGWEIATGKPTPAKLKELGLEEFIPDIWGK
ncbi:MAG: aldehyde ferredoxin oxidoreductase family protein, partial [Dehalococcoidia bacterium]|nr:aldehyde ferredoxin oxidoreductase family protein [Dehalococcoidia bacterium]